MSAIENVLKGRSTVIANVVLNVASPQPTCKDLYYSVNEDTERMATKFISSSRTLALEMAEDFTRIVSMTLHMQKEK